MKPGPPKTPTALRVLKGNPSRRPLPKDEPTPAKGAPGCPTWLDREGAAEWKRIVPALDKIGMLAQVDRASLAAYCSTWSMFVAARRGVERDGTTLVTDKGQVVTNPDANLVVKLAATIRAYCQEFGLTPSARGRMQVPGEPQGGADDFAREYGG